MLVCRLELQAVLPYSAMQHSKLSVRPVTAEGLLSWLHKKQTDTRLLQEGLRGSFSSVKIHYVTRHAAGIIAGRAAQGPAPCQGSSF